MGTKVVDDQHPHEDKHTNNEQKNFATSRKQKGIQFIHLNIHYISPKLDELKYLLTKYNNPEIIGLCETFLNDSFDDNEFMIHGYTMFRKDRQSHGGGVLLYVNDQFSCNRRYDLEHDHCESLWIEVKIPQQKSFTVGYFYRPPSVDREWLTNIENTLEKAYLENKELILFGDFNINFVNGVCSNNSWTQITNCYNLVQLVTEHTRVTQTSATTIDHVYTNMPQHFLNTHIYKESLSDHYLLSFTRKISGKSTTSTHNSITYRSFKNLDNQHFLRDLSSQPLNAVQSFDDPNHALEFLYQMLTDTLNKHAPIKQRRIKHIHQPDWFNTEILNAIKCRDKAKQSNNHQSYKYWRREVKKLCKKSKHQYYKHAINNNSNPKLLWNNLKLLSGKSTIHNTTQINDSDSSPITNSKDTAEFFNQHFINVFQLSQSQDSLPSNHISKILNYTTSKLSPGTSFHIPPISEDFIRKQLQALDTKKSTGLDELGPCILQISANILAKPLYHIFNLSIRKGTFPEVFKNAKVTPVYKKGSFQDVNNYRPISILPVLSKIIERHVTLHFRIFLEDNNLLQNTQSGFRNNHSCETALVSLMDDWLSAINNQNVVGTVMLDLSKAFDMVNHRLLLEKLQLYQCSSLSLKWFKSYLTNRHQQVSVSGTLSKPLPISAGVPQGSVLGPLMFLLYINDLPLHIPNTNTAMFADDTTLHTFGKNLTDISNNLQDSLSAVSEWCKSNSMILNGSKTKSMLISASNKHQLTTNFSFTLLDDSLQITSTEKLLGVTFDHNLNFKSHVEIKLRKCNSLLFLLMRIKCFLDLKTRKLFYNAYILPHLDYCITVWGNSSNQLMDQLLKFQKRAARIILDENFDSPSAPLFLALKWMTIYERLEYKQAILVYKSLTQNSPTFLASKLQKVQYTERQLTSSSNDLLLVQLYLSLNLRYLENPSHMLDQNSGTLSQQMSDMQIQWPLSKLYT